jgi:uncharacterized membrane protein
MNSDKKFEAIERSLNKFLGVLGLFFEVLWLGLFLLFGSGAMATISAMKLCLNVAMVHHLFSKKYTRSWFLALLSVWMVALTFQIAMVQGLLMASAAGLWAIALLVASLAQHNKEQMKPEDEDRQNENP